MKSTCSVLSTCSSTAAWLLLGVLLVGFASCAKIADPEPPELRVPKAAVDAAVRQVGDRIVVSVSLPVENTNGTRALTLGAVEVLRVAGDRSDAGPLPQDVFLSRAEKIYEVPVEGLGPFLNNGRLVFVDPNQVDPGTFYGQGYRYSVRFINRKNQTAGLSNQAFVAPVPIPPTPDGLMATVMRDRILLAWHPPVRNADGSSPARIAGYNVYRTQDPREFPSVPFNGELLSKPEFEDRDFSFDQRYYYEVTVVGSAANPYAESLPTQPLAVTPHDTFPPGSPKNLAYVLQNGVVTLLWEPPDDADLAGFRVYRQEAGTAERTVLQEEPAMVMSFRDEKAVSGKKYEYTVVAVDKNGNAGQPAAVTVEVQ